MKTLYLDCFSGISGDMFAAAMLDLGVSGQKLLNALKSLNISGYDVKISKVLKNGISATDFNVVTGLPGGTHAHRTYSDIKNIIGSSGLSAGVKELSLKIFGVIAAAEGKVHSVEPENVHFHEVGAVDSIVDIVAAAVCIEELKPDKILFSELKEGCGTVETAHGLLPVPAPATAEILSAANIPFECTNIKTELVTPTGAAIAAALSQGFCRMPLMAVRKTGYGAGKKQLERANVLRAFIGEQNGDATPQTVAVLETCVDDSTGEELGFCLERLFEAGALDACYSPVFMKKNRPAYKLTALCRAQDVDKISNLIFEHTGAAGLRYRLSERIIMQRELSEIATKYGTIKCKTYSAGGIAKQKPEFESLRAAALKHDVSIRRVISEFIKNL